MESKMKLRWHALVLIAVFAVAPSAFALSCKAEHFKAATTLAELPIDVRNLMLQDGPLADHGEAFEQTDVVDRNPLPLRRFGVAALGTRRIFAVVQHGGGPNYTEIWSFDRAGGQWKGCGSRGMPKHSVVGTPESLPELLYSICDGYPEPAPRPPLASVPSL
jgi:hypothetical protein